MPDVADRIFMKASEGRTTKKKIKAKAIKSLDKNKQIVGGIVNKSAGY